MKSSNHFRSMPFLMFLAVEFLLSANIWAEPQMLAQFQAKDMRLSAKITLIMKGISLGDAVQQISKQTGVKLSVQSSWADQKIQLFAQDRLLHEVLAALEHLYPGYWAEKEMSSGQEYIFKPEDWLLRKRKSWWQDVNSLADTAEDQRKAYQRNHFDENLRAVMQSQGQNPEENGGPDSSLVAKYAAQATSSLPGQMKQSLIDQAQFLQPGLYPALRPTEWVPVDSLSSETQKSLEGLYSASNKFNERQNTAADQPLDSQSLRQGMLGFTSINGSLRLFLNIPGSNREIAAAVAYLEPINGSLNALNAYDHDGLVRLNALGKKELEQKYGSEIARLIQKLARLHKEVFWPSSNAEGISDVKLSINSSDTENRYGLVTLHDILDIVSKKTGIPIISDFYSKPFVKIPIVKDLPLAQVCDQLAQQFDYSWQMHQGMLFWRNNRWYRDDAFEIPNKWLNRWKKMLVKDTSAKKLEILPPNIDVYTEIANTLTPDQIHYGLGENQSDDGLWCRLCPKIKAQTDLLRLYASLPPDYKEYIKSQGLPARLLNISQQQQLMALLRQDPLSQNSENIHDSSIRLDLSQDMLSVIKPFKIIIDSFPDTSQ